MIPQAGMTPPWNCSEKTRFWLESEMREFAKCQADPLAAPSRQVSLPPVQNVKAEGGTQIVSLLCPIGEVDDHSSSQNERSCTCVLVDLRPLARYTSGNLASISSTSGGKPL